MHHAMGVLLMGGALVGAGLPALDDAGLASILQQRLAGDRTGACMAVAVIDESVSRAVVCAADNNKRAIDYQTAFEIGSVSKTMTATLAAELIAENKLSLDDPLSTHVPKGVDVPEFDGKPILIRHLMTHTSGLPSLPSRLTVTSLDDPYAKLSAKDLYASLAEVKLNAAPGTSFAYSNFAMMLVSDIVARRAGRNLDQLLQDRLFGPLDMRNSFLGAAAKGTRVAKGHLQTGAETPAWNFSTNLAGVGGVRSSLDDMVHYVQAQLGRRDSALDPAIKLTQRPLSELPGARMAMNWMLLPGRDAQVLAHEGGTGGFSAFVAFDREAGRGVVILSDTALTAVGGLGQLGTHLLNGSMPPGSPRKREDAPAQLRAALIGDYVLEGGMRMKLSEKDGALVIQASGQPAFEMGYDSAGDFYPLQFDALLSPTRSGDGGYNFVWNQAGASVSAKRVVDKGAQALATYPKLNAEQARAYVGSYPLMPGFALDVIAEGDNLYVQGTGQQRIAVVAVARDVVLAESVGAEISFERDAAGAVIALVLRQGGQTLRGARQ